MINATVQYPAGSAQVSCWLKAPYTGFSSGSRQHTRCTYVQQTLSTHTLVHFVASYSASARGAGPHVYCLVRKMESDGEVLQACAAIVVDDVLLEKPKRKRKKWVNDYLLKKRGVMAVY